MIDNTTPFVVEPLALSDQQGRPLLVVVAKATYELRSNALILAEAQLPMCFSGESRGEPGLSSYLYEPEVSWLKPSTDVVLIAHAWAPRVGTTALDIEFGVGPLRSVARVFGDRFWLKTRDPSISVPQPFESIPLSYEQAFGGWDRRGTDAAQHCFDPRNPVGRGFYRKDSQVEAGMLLPNLEDPRALVRGLQDRPTPVGFGYTSAHWQPRAALAGTYDEAWAERRAPQLPVDFNRRFFNAASAGLVAPGYLVGNEAVRGSGVSRDGRLDFSLPSQQPPAVRVALRNAEDETPVMQLDTVIVNTDEDKVLLLWRTELTLDEGPHDVLAIQVSSKRIEARTAA